MRVFSLLSDSTSQVGGRVVHYDKMTFATVRNAGHMVRTLPTTYPVFGMMSSSVLMGVPLPLQVPSFQPLRALEMFSQFLSGKF